MSTSTEKRAHLRLVDEISETFRDIRTDREGAEIDVRKYVQEMSAGKAYGREGRLHEKMTSSQKKSSGSTENHNLRVPGVRRDILVELPREVLWSDYVDRLVRFSDGYVERGDAGLILHTASEAEACIYRNVTSVDQWTVQANCLITFFWYFRTGLYQLSVYSNGTVLYRQRNG